MFCFVVLLHGSFSLPNCVFLHTDARNLNVNLFFNFRIHQPSPVTTNLTVYDTSTAYIRCRSPTSQVPILRNDPLCSEKSKFSQGHDPRYDRQRFYKPTLSAAAIFVSSPASATCHHSRHSMRSTSSTSSTHPTNFHLSSTNDYSLAEDLSSYPVIQAPTGNDQYRSIAFSQLPSTSYRVETRPRRRRPTLSTGTGISTALALPSTPTSMPVCTIPGSPIHYKPTKSMKRISVAALIE